MVVNPPKCMSTLYHILQAVSSFDDDEFFYMRIAITGADKNWDKNCFNCATYENLAFSVFSMQSFECDWYRLPYDESKKAINDKLHPEKLPLFFLQPTFFHFGNKIRFDSATSFLNSYSFGERQYEFMNEEMFKQVLPKDDIVRMIENRHCYMQGHLLNRYETAFFLPFPCETCSENFSKKLLTLSAKPIPEKFQSNGIDLGYQEVLNGKTSLCMPISHLQHSVMFIGEQGFGKTNELLNILSQIVSIKNPKYSVIVFYFHDFEFVKRLVSVVPKYRLKDVIIASPMMRGKILGRNYVDGSKVKDASRMAANLAYALENSSVSFGVDIKFDIKKLMSTLLVSKNSAFDHALNIMDREDPIGILKRKEARTNANDKLIHRFLDHVESKTNNTKKIDNKLPDFFDEYGIAQMSAYSGENLLTYDDVIKNGKILIWYLGDCGTAGNTIASMEVSMLHHFFQGLGRSNNISHYPTIVTIDEVQRIRAKGVTDSIREDRKYGLSYILSTQTMHGIDPALYEGIELIPNCAFFQCPEDDAKFFQKKCAGIIKPNDINRLDKYEMYVRMLTAKDIYQCKTREFMYGEDNLDFVIKNCLEKYYIDPNQLAELREEHELSLKTGGRPKQEKKKLANLPKEVLNKFNSFLSKGE